MYPVTLTGHAVTLREFGTGDATAAYRIVGDDTVTRSLSFDSRTEREAAEMIQGAVDRAKQSTRTEYYLAVTLADDELIGFARLGLGGVQAAKLGGAIKAGRWGMGYATDAAHTMIDFGFRELGLHRITAAIGPDNTASIALVERLGMRYEGRLRDHVFTNGSWRDSVLYSVLASEWESEDG